MRKFLKWSGIAIGSLAGALLLVAVVVFLVGSARLNAVHAIESPLAGLEPSAERIERGRHVAMIHGCTHCHGKDFSGQVFLDIPPGRFVASNLTSGKGGVGESYTGSDWDRAVRFGLRHDRRNLLPLMPSSIYRKLADSDAAALSIFLDQLAPVDNVLPPSEVRPIGYLMVAFDDGNELRANNLATIAESPPIATDSQYGAYLASTACAHCHGAGLAGGKHPAPQAPPVPGLLHTATWELADFDAAVRQGLAPGGRELSGWMPARDYLHHLDETEVAALHAHVQTLADRQKTNGPLASR